VFRVDEVSAVSVTSIRPFSRRLGRVALLLWLNACHVWRPQTLGPATRFDSKAHVRVERNDGSSVVFIGPRIVGDSVIGLWAGSSSRLAVAVSDVRRVDEYRASPARTTLTVLGVVGGAVIVVGAVLGLMIAGLSASMSTTP
jgi:hypothetical protein